MTKICAACGAVATCKCAACHNIAYCGRECQRDDWPSHKRRCAPAAETLRKNLPVGVMSRPAGTPSHAVDAHSIVRSISGWVEDAVAGDPLGALQLASMATMDAVAALPPMRRAMAAVVKVVNKTRLPLAAEAFRPISLAGAFTGHSTSVVSEAATFFANLLQWPSNHEFARPRLGYLVPCAARMLVGGGPLLRRDDCSLEEGWIGVLQRCEDVDPALCRAHLRDVATVASL